MNKEVTLVKELRSLITVESAYVYEFYKLIYAISSDITLINTREFKGFVEHFHLFVRFQAASEALLIAIDSLHTVYSGSLIQPLFDSQAMAAAEQLESAIEYLEMIKQDRGIRKNSQFILLNQSLGLLEETNFKILEIIKEYIEKCSSETQLQN